MGLILTLVVISILLVMVGIAFKGILWVAAVGAVLLLITFALMGARRTS